MHKVTDGLVEPRYKLAQAKGEEIWKTLAQGKLPVMLNDVTQALGAKCSERDLDCNGITSLHADGTFYIVYKKGVLVERQRFTVAHEIGHIALDHITFSGESSQFSNRSQEQEADAFASALLIPPSDLKAYMKNKDKSLEDIMKRYWVSKSAATAAITGNKLLNKLYVD